MSNFYNKVSLAYTKPMNKRMTLQEISQANQWINGENGNNRHFRLCVPNCQYNIIMFLPTQQTCIK